ncbi:splicing factor 3b subunit 4 [Grosmannia clavigera kw1407]|uniref:Splicing factor 3b subunit 4 n=1 Tax=Grosmannia clavigera (strain kw1407 / UAMH 11150) TaxID=655863 RepID=F0XRE5_GROCL|nr:splicing factor 3b subunit 4 [Grosmannia clavigera kw1407]EFW99847.1 splicing factor 3b subunit 4 [Grosmannia clavigera kw1407]
MSGRHWEQNKEATVYVGNLDERFSEPLMWELMTQMGPVVNVHMPMDRVSRLHQGFGFVEFDTPESAEYASRTLNGIRLYGKPVRVNKASADRQRAAEIGAELFVNNLDPQVDEKILYDTFAQFGRLVAPPNVVRDQNNISKGYGFVSFDSFDASDTARDAMQGQYLLSKQISVEYAYKKDGKGERHGDEAERKLAAEGKKHNVVPDVQPMPSAFYMTHPNPNPVLPPGPAVGAIAAPPPNIMAAPLGGNPNGIAPPGSYAPPSRGPVPMAAPGAPGALSFHPRQQQQQQQQQQQPYGAPGGMPPSLPAGFGGPQAGRGAMAPPPSFPAGRGGPGLPMAPTGLPARPPPGGVGSGPPGFGRPPPPGFGGGGGQQQQQLPPSGFATGANSVGMAPPGLPVYNGMPPPPPPAGFGRR